MLRSAVGAAIEGNRTVRRIIVQLLEEYDHPRVVKREAKRVSFKTHLKEFEEKLKLAEQNGQAVATSAAQRACDE